VKNFQIGDSVIVKAGTKREWYGNVVGLKAPYVVVEDMDGDAWDIEPRFLTSDMAEPMTIQIS
jgi:hypothetical protein